MGLFVHLIINFNGIESKEWEAAYLESVELLDKFPAPLMRLKVEEIDDHKRYVSTANIRDNVDIENERWEIAGDLTSYKRAESFVLYRNLRKYTDNKNSFFQEDVLWADNNNISYVNGCGIDIFGNKTQGYPYHLVVLSVGILFENRFPENIYVLGDIECGQVENVIKWMNNILDKPVSSPICMDAKRLWNRIDTLYSDKRLAIERFRTLFAGSDEEELRVLLNSCDNSIVFKYYFNEINQYSSLSQLGAERIIMQCLTATQDLKQLIKFIYLSSVKKGEKKIFRLENLLKVLCTMFITIDFEEREPLSLFDKTSGRLVDIEETIFRTLILMGNVPTNVNFYICSNELLELFCFFESRKREVFKDIIEKSEAECRKNLKDIADKIEEMEKQIEDSKAEISIQDNVKKEVSQQAVSKKDDADYLLHEIKSQIKIYPDPEKTAKTISEQLRNIIKQNKEKFDSMDRQRLLNLIIDTSFDCGFALRESAWAELDKEENLEILKSLLILSFIKNNEKSFWHWRIYILEHKELWKYLILNGAS